MRVSRTGQGAHQVSQPFPGKSRAEIPVPPAESQRGAAGRGQGGAGGGLAEAGAGGEGAMQLIWQQEEEIPSLTKGCEAPALQFPAVPGLEQSWGSTSLPNPNPVPGGGQGEPSSAHTGMPKPSSFPAHFSTGSVNSHFHCPILLLLSSQDICSPSHTPSLPLTHHKEFWVKAQETWIHFSFSLDLAVERLQIYSVSYGSWELGPWSISARASWALPQEEKSGFFKFPEVDPVAITQTPGINKGSGLVPLKPWKHPKSNSWDVLDFCFRWQK